jgi:hypothetical protein
MFQEELFRDTFYVVGATPLGVQTIRNAAAIARLVMFFLIFRIRTVVIRIRVRICGCVPLITDPDRILLFSSVGFKQ